MTFVGQKLGRYRLVGLLASTHMSEVYLAKDSRINQQVAIKINPDINSPAPDPNAVRLFRREAKAIAMLNHPHILPLFDYGEETIGGKTLIYIVMPYLQEGSFADWLRQPNYAAPLSPQDAAHFIEQAADALQYAHDEQIIHRDVKPSNFLIRSNKKNPNHPDLLLADFGIARLNTATSKASQTVRGSPAYMAPEQWGGNPVPATDQYALAIMTYELLTGQLPFNGNQQQIMFQHLQSQPQPPSAINPSIPASIDSVIMRALAKKPEDRFPSISEFALAFQKALQPPPLSPAPISPKPQPSNRTSWVTVVVTLAILILLIVGGVEGTTSIIKARQLADATATATVQANISALATASSSSVNHYPPFGGTLTLDDPLSNSSKSSQWDRTSDCIFTGGAYHVVAPNPGYFIPCYAKATNFSNFVYQVQMMIINGDCGAIILRANWRTDQIYYFRICRDGDYHFSLYVDNTGTNAKTLKSDSTSAIKTGLNESNLIAVVARGSIIELYINLQHIADVYSDAYSQGQIGVAAEAESNPTEVAYSNAKVWTL